MFLQSLMKFHQRLSKILRKQNVTDTLSFVRSFVRLFIRTDNVKTVYPPTNTVCGGYNDTDRFYLVKLLLLFNDPKFTGRQIWAIDADQNQNAPRGGLISVFIDWCSTCIFEGSAQW